MRTTLFSNFKIKDLFLILIMAGSVGLIVHFTFIDRLGFWRFIYPVQAQIAIFNIHCSKNSPIWMQSSLKYIIYNQKTLSNQLAYIDQNNHIYTCQSGWQKKTLLSKSISENTRFRYASMTKIVTHNAVIELINQGKLALDDRMVNFFVELKDQKFKDNRMKNITISDLLQHRSGFDRMRSEDVMFASNKTPWCPKQLDKILTVKLDFEPNKYYAYDNRNSCLLGAVVERITGKNYRNYIQQKYKLNDRNIRFVDGAYYPDEVRYDFRNSDFWMEGYSKQFDFNALSSSAGLSGSAKSLSQLIKKMLNKNPLNILSIASDNLQHCDISIFKSCNGYAMWQYQKNKQSHIMFFKNGVLPAATSLAMVTDKQEVIVWTSNGATLYSENLDGNLLEKYFYQIFNSENLK